MHLFVSSAQPHGNVPGVRIIQVDLQFLFGFLLIELYEPEKRGEMLRDVLPYDEMLPQVKLPMN